MEKNKKKYIGSMLIMLLLIAVTFYTLLKDNAASELTVALKQVNISIIFFGLVIMLMFIMSEAYNIKIILKTMNVRAGYFACLKYAFIGFYFSAVTPSAAGGQPMQIYYMNKDKINIANSSMVFLVIAFAYQSVSMLYVIVMFMLKKDLALAHISNMKWFLLYGIVINVILISAILFAIFSHKAIKKVIYAILNILHKFHIVKDIDSARESTDKQIDEYRKGASFIKSNPKLFVRVFAVTAFQLTCSYIIPFIVYKAFGLSGYNALDIIAMQSILTLCVSSLPLPGAVGAAEGGFMVMFRIFFAESLILPAMLLSRMISFYSFVIISAVVTVIAHIRISFVKNKE